MKIFLSQESEEDISFKVGSLVELGLVDGSILILVKRIHCPEYDQVLINAASSRNFEGFLKDLQGGAGVDYQSSRGKTALFWASKNGFTEIARTLIRRGANINIQSFYGNTALICAADNSIEIVKLLIEAKTNLDIENIWGWSAMKIAESKKDEKTMALLRKAVASDPV